MGSNQFILPAVSASVSRSPFDIWKWTRTQAAIAPCFVRDVFSMRESGVKGMYVIRGAVCLVLHLSSLQDANYFWLGYIPCCSVLLVGMVVAVREYEKRVLYTRKPLSSSLTLGELSVSLDRSRRWNCSHRLRSSTCTIPGFEYHCERQGSATVDVA